MVQPFHKTEQGARFMVVVGGLMFALGVLNLIINTEVIGSWLPLIVITPLGIIEGARTLREKRKRPPQGRRND